jgi:ribosome maturation factor RimP
MVNGRAIFYGLSSVEVADLKRKLLPLMEAVVRQEGLELVDVEIGGGKRRPTLQVFVERPADQGTVTIEDCARVSRYLGPALDVEDLLPGAYVLEVSSPGIERPLRTPEHFARFTGRKVKLVAEGTGYLEGVLGGVREGVLTVDDGKNAREIPLSSVTRAHLWVPMDDLFQRKGKGKGSSDE